MHVGSTPRHQKVTEFAFSRERVDMGFMGDIDEENSREREAANLHRLFQRSGMQPTIRPVRPKDDNARKAGCQCNHRSSKPGKNHHPSCVLYQN